MGFITLRSYTNAIDAGMAKSLLDNHQIVSSLADENSHLYGGGPMAMPVRLLVAEEQAERAAHILDNARPPLPDDFDPGDSRASESGANREVSELEKVRRTNQIITALLIVLLLLTIYLISELPRRTSPWTKVSQATREYDYKTALALAQQLAKEHPSDYYAHEVMGNIYYDIGDLDHAESEYSLAYDLSPPEHLQAKLKAVRERRQREQSTRPRPFSTPKTS